MKFLRDQTIIQGVLVNKTNHLSVFFYIWGNHVWFVSKFWGISRQDLKQSKLDTFFTWEFLTNENILRVPEKHKFDIDDFIWCLAKKPEAGKNLNRKKLSRDYDSKKAGAFCTYINEQKQKSSCRNILLHRRNTVGVYKYWSESHIRFMDPISRVIYCNYTLTLCNKTYLNAFQSGNVSWVSYSKQLKSIRTPKRTKKELRNNMQLWAPWILAVEVFSRMKIWDTVSYHNLWNPSKDYNRKRGLPGTKRGKCSWSIGPFWLKIYHRAGYIFHAW